VKTAADLDKIFNEELKRLRTDYVDYYLMHMLTDVNAWERMKSLGILEWIEEKKKSGAIRQVGFSYHGNSQIFCDLVDAWDWDFCQIQYNYMDEHTQAGRRGLYHAHEKGIPVIIMEPLRGGKLVNNLCAEAEEIFAGHEPKRTPAQWAFRWLWNQPEVTVVLSGMNTDEMVADNMMTASTVEVGELTAADEAMLQQVVKAINAGMKVGCTACAYCMPCPKGVNIPGTFAAYNRIYSESKFAGMKEYFMSNALRKEPTLASQCVGCGKCEKHCPQGIAIRQELKNAQKELENPVFNAARKLAGLITKFKG
jgi:predicted aldo/keto reductase-like oxidoreductase